MDLNYDQSHLGHDVMKITWYEPVPDQRWAGSVVLDEAEWPPGKTADYLKRPIFRWVHDNCSPVCFTAKGFIMFGKSDDLTQFVLTWS